MLRESKQLTMDHLLLKAPEVVELPFRQPKQIWKLHDYLLLITSSHISKFSQAFLPSGDQDEWLYTQAPIFLRNPHQPMRILTTSQNLLMPYNKYLNG